jgi:hypothetical protein
MTMIRLSGTGTKLVPTDVNVNQPRRRRRNHHDALFAAIEEISEHDRRGGVLFIGSCEPAAMATRIAQAVQRHDRSPGRWSHVALVLDWPAGARPDEVTGLECSLDPFDAKLAVPERNGVTPFRLSRYRDSRRYPNLAFGTLCSPKPAGEKGKRDKKGKDGAGESEFTARKDQLRKLALRPADDRSRYPLWEWLGVWQAFTHGVGENPLSRNIGHPGASFCESVYRSLGIDLTPGALSPSASPEVLWSTLLYWHDQLAPDRGEVRVWTSLVDPDNLARTALPPLSDADLAN